MTLSRLATIVNKDGSYKEVELSVADAYVVIDGTTYTLARLEEEHALYRPYGEVLRASTFTVCVSCPNAKEDLKRLLASESKNMPTLPTTWNYVAKKISQQGKKAVYTVVPTYRGK